MCPNHTAQSGACLEVEFEAVEEGGGLFRGFEVFLGGGEGFVHQHPVRERRLTARRLRVSSVTGKSGGLGLGGEVLSRRRGSAAWF